MGLRTYMASRLARTVAAGALVLSLVTLGAAPALAADGDVEDWARAENRPIWTLSKLTGPFVQLASHVSVFNDSSDRPLLASVFGYSVRGGYRWSGWGVFGVIEHDLWLGLEQESSVRQGAINIGVGGELTYAEGFVRTALSVGASILAEATALDDAGTTGVFMDLRPVGLRFDVHRNWVIGLDPLGFALVMPVLDGIPLTQLEYRSSLYVEAAW